MTIIGFVGFIGSGKGTAGDILADDHNFLRESFAKPVKDAVAPIFGWERSLLEGDTVQSRAFREQPDAFWSKAFGRDFTPREALQKMGTEVGRNVFDKDLWVNSMERRLDFTNNYVITDVRFPNEIEMIQRLNGRVIRVIRGPNPEWYNCALELNNSTSPQSNPQVMREYPEVHYSEWAWVGKPMELLDNNGTFEELKNHIKQLLFP